VNRKLLSTLLVITLISISVPAAFSDVVTLDDIRCQELPSPAPCDVTQASADVQFLLDSLGIPSQGPSPPAVCLPGPPPNCDSSEVISSIFTIPGLPDTESVDVKFTLERDTGSFLFAFGFCPASSVVGIDPVTQTLAFATACMTAATQVFDDNVAVVGDMSTHNLPVGETLIFWLIPDNTLAIFLADPTQFFPSQTLDNPFRAPLFSVDVANPGEFDQLLSFVGGGKTLFTWEDLTRSDIVPPGASDEDFTDLAFSIDLEFIPKPFCEIFPDLPVCKLIGGEFSQIDTTALLVAGATSSIAYYMYAFTALGIGAFWFARNPYNVRNVKTIMGDYLDRFRKTN